MGERRRVVGAWAMVHTAAENDLRGQHRHVREPDTVPTRGAPAVQGCCHHGSACHIQLRVAVFYRAAFCSTSSLATRGTAYARPHAGRVSGARRAGGKGVEASSRGSCSSWRPHLAQHVQPQPPELRDFSAATTPTTVAPFTEPRLRRSPCTMSGAVSDATPSQSVALSCICAHSSSCARAHGRPQPQTERVFTGSRGACCSRHGV